MLSKYPLETDLKFGSEPITAIMKENTTSSDVSHKNYTMKTNQVLRTAKERHNYSCNKTREKFLQCVFVKKTLYSAVKVS